MSVTAGKPQAFVWFQSRCLEATGECLIEAPLGARGRVRSEIRSVAGKAGLRVSVTAASDSMLLVRLLSEEA